MNFSEKILYKISKKRVEKEVIKLKAKNKELRGLDYAQLQFDKYLQRGVPYNICNKTILEIGCGHGGISTFLALNGAKKVYGIDINEYNLETAKKFKRNLENKIGTKDLPVEFLFSKCT